VQRHHVRADGQWVQASGGDNRLDASTHRLIHPSASTLQPAPAFFAAFVPFCGQPSLNSCRLAQVAFSPPAWGWCDSFGDEARPR
jgi:hypothetical protein